MSTIFKKSNDGNQNIRATIYVGNLDPKVTETLLYELFIQFAPVKSLHLPRDRILKTHQGFGFIEFKNEEDAKYVLQILKGVRLYGKLLRARISDSKPTVQSQNKNVGTVKTVDVGAKIFIRNLNQLIDEKFLNDTFQSFGKIVQTPSIVRDPETGESKGQGYITFNDFESSDNAIKSLNGKILMNNKVIVTYAYKDENSKVKHGDKVERLLAENAKKHKMLDLSQPKKRFKKN